MRNSKSPFGDGIELSCTVASKPYTWTINHKSVNYRILFERFGSDPAKWKGIVKVGRKKHKGNDYVAVVG